MARVIGSLLFIDEYALSWYHKAGGSHAPIQRRSDHADRPRHHPRILGYWPHAHPDSDPRNRHRCRTSWRRCRLVFTLITERKGPNRARAVGPVVYQFNAVRERRPSDNSWRHRELRDQSAIARDREWHPRDPSASFWLHKDWA